MTNIPSQDTAALVLQLPTAPLSQIADIIRRDWKNPHFAAVPYIRAMLQCQSIEDSYIAESARDITLYFLSNAANWRGPVAKVVKIELRRRLGLGS